MNSAAPPAPPRTNFEVRSVLEIYVRQWPDGMRATLGSAARSGPEQIDAAQCVVAALAEMLGVKPYELPVVLGLARRSA